MKKLATRPLVSDELCPLVEFQFGTETGHLTATQAEQIAESLSRAATAARYEAGIAELLAAHDNSPEEIKAAIEDVRRFIETRRLRNN